MTLKDVSGDLPSFAVAVVASAIVFAVSLLVALICFWLGRGDLSFGSVLFGIGSIAVFCPAYMDYKRLCQERDRADDEN